MDPTTLITFLFKTPAHVRSVELLGSWDNFKLPYTMHHDRRRGAGHWSGCFKFENIIFDGDEIKWHKPRSGGLKQGGTYWYFYRLNDDVEAYDDTRPVTTECPLMRGQVINVMEVPTEIIRAPSRCRSAYGDILGTLANIPEQQTLDPLKKFDALDPPPISKYHDNSKSDDALHRRLQEPFDPSPMQTKQYEEQHSPPQPSDSRLSLSSDDDVSLLSQDSYREDNPYSHRQAGVHPSDGFETDSVIDAYSDSSAASLIDPDEHQLPSFPYPNVLGATPITSTADLCGSLFPSTEAPRDSVLLDFDGVGIESETHDVMLSQATEEQTKPSLTTLTTIIPARPCSSSYSVTDLITSPVSVQNVQFYGGSRPASSISRHSSSSSQPTLHLSPYRHRMYSLPNLLLRNSYPAAQPLRSRQKDNPARHSQPSPNLAVTIEGNSSPPDLLTPTLSSACTVSSEGSQTPKKPSSFYPAITATWTDSKSEASHFESSAVVCDQKTITQVPKPHPRRLASKSYDGIPRVTVLPPPRSARASPRKRKSKQGKHKKNILSSAIDRLLPGTAFTKPRRRPPPPPPPRPLPERSITQDTVNASPALRADNTTTRTPDDIHDDDGDFFSDMAYLGSSIV